MLGLDSVVFHAIDANRLERPIANMQRHTRAFDTARRERVENLRCKVQARSGRRNRASLPRIDGLISLAIECAIRTLDVRRQRNMSNRIDRFAHRRTIVSPKAHRSTTMKMPAEYFGVQVAAPGVEAHP